MLPLDELDEKWKIVHDELDPHEKTGAERIEQARLSRLAYRAGRIPRKSYATASSPIEGLVGR